MTKKLYCITMPVHAQVTVLVQAEDDAKAEQIAAWAADISDSEPIDFASVAPDIAELKLEDIRENDTVYLRKGFAVSGKTLREVMET